MEEYQIFTLPNGIRVAHREVANTKIAHCGFTLDIGTRDELPEQMGVAHFWEHMAFKGTDKRKPIHIINRLEVVGGELNAYTTKEKICFFASILDTHFEKAFELLTDITFHSVFPQKEIEKEKSVILEEMSMYLDSPEDAIQDEFEEQIFANHPLGYNILGEADVINNVQKEDFYKFINQNLDNERLIFNSIGNIPAKKVFKLAEKYLSDLPVRKSHRIRKRFEIYSPTYISREKSILQAHCMVGCPSYAMEDDKRLPFFMLVNLLGGPGMNSRLNLALREKHGLVYNIEANLTSFTDCGLFSIYFATEKKQLKRSIDLVQKELKKLREHSLGVGQLHACKQQLMGQLAMAEESNMNYMQMMGKSLLDLGQIDSLAEIFDQIQKVSAQELLEIANEMFNDQNLSTLTYLPE
jgi:predicted Zn-dependent peptidase